MVDYHKTRTVDRTNGLRRGEGVKGMGELF